MGNLTDFNDGPIVNAIFDLYKKRGDAEKPRAYLGGSAIGDDCSRKLWYGFRWASAPAFTGRLYRLFDTGHHAEPRFIKDLRDIGVEVWERDPKTGKQFAFSDVYGHFRGNTDGMGRKIPGGGAKDHLLEFKTHGSKSFAELTKKGIVEAKPMHWIQMNTYMGWAGYERAVYGAVNKDTEDLHFERLKFDPLVFMQTQAKAEAIIFAPLPPSRLSDDPAFYKCKMCDHADVCHGKRVPQKSCRTCVHATPTNTGDGAWHCARFDIEPTHDQQLTGCMAHLPLPPLLQYAEPEDAGEDWILFRHKKTMLQFVVGTVVPAELIDLPLYSSADISAAPGAAITDPHVTDLMTTFGATFK
ncbi:MAG: oxidoreductase [Telluria sp.]